MKKFITTGVLMLASSIYAQPNCSCDFNQDGRIDLGDMGAVINAFLGSARSTCHAGVVNLGDVGRVQNAFLNGVCTPMASTPLSQCQPIATPGYYTLQVPVSGQPLQSCFPITVGGVTLDLGGMKITMDRATHAGSEVAVDVINAPSSVLIKNGAISSINTDPTHALYGIRLRNSPDAGIIGVTLADAELDAADTPGIQVLGNTVSNAPIFIIRGDNAIVDSNHVTLDLSRQWAAGYIISDSVNPALTGNWFWSPWVKGMPTSSGPDDGYLYSNWQGGKIVGNHSTGTWDVCYENTGHIVNILMDSNECTESFIGIGGWWGNSMDTVTLSNNTMDRVKLPFRFYRSDAVLPGEQVYMRNINVVGNRVLNPTYYGPYPVSWPVSLFTLGYGVPGIIAGNNHFGNNDFGGAAAHAQVEFAPSSSIVDDGGNHCLTTTIPGLTCVP